MKTLIILPSYNESQNIVALIRALLNESQEYRICVVDDNSPDGTGGEIEKLLKQDPDARARVHLIIRKKKDGRGGAVRDGIRWGLENTDCEAFVEMDCDFSHRPEDVKRGVSMLSEYDVVMGSRYPHGKIIGWPVRRKVLSFSANLLAKSMISWSVGDYTNGFRFYTRRAAQFLSEKPQKHKGYIYLSETISYFLKAGFKIGSFPIVFVNRQRGESNTNLSEVTSALKGILDIGWNHRFGARN